jgi:hypothetical protein
MRYLKFSSGLWLFGFLLALACPAAAEIPEKDRAEIEQLRSVHGRPAEDVEPLLAQVSEAGARGLPQGLLLNKVKEGLAKGVETPRIGEALSDAARRLELSQNVLHELAPPGRRHPQRAVQVLAEAFGRNITPDDVRELHRRAAEGRQPLTAEELAYGVKGLALMKSAGVSGMDVVAEGMRQGYRPSDFIHLGREVRMHRDALLANPERLHELQQEIGQGRRPNDLFHAHPGERRLDRRRR